MRLILEGEQRLRLQARGEGLTVESADPRVYLSPLHMLAASLATCTLSVLAGWADHAGLDATEIEIGLTWDYVEGPYRVGRFDLAIRWPGLPPARQAAVERVAAQCTVLHTLEHPPAIQKRIET